MNYYSYTNFIKPNLFKIKINKVPSTVTKKTDMMPNQGLGIEEKSVQRTNKLNGITKTKTPIKKSFNP